MKSNYSRLNILILTIILGVLIAFQVKGLDNKHNYVSLDKIRYYKKSIEKENAEIENLKNVIDDHKNKINDYQITKIRDGDITQLLRDEIEAFKTISGFSNVYGPGVMIIIDDASRELYEGENPNDVLVHNVDILNIINDLKIAGAEAISINGQRILSITEIDCSGNTIEINGKDYGHPFIIKAIGEPNHLEAAVNGPLAYGHLLKEYGIFVEVNTLTRMEISKFDDEITYKHTITKK